MIYLKRHDYSNGDWTLAWQAFLAGEGLFEGHYARNFGPKTEAATRAFQDHGGYIETGEVSRDELIRALNLGFAPPDSWLRAALAAGDIVQDNFDRSASEPASGVKHCMADGQPVGYMNPTWPQPSDLDGDGRADLVYLGEAGRQALWGPVEFELIKGSPKQLGDWGDKNIIRVHVPQLAGVDRYGNPSSGNVHFHRLAAPQLLGAFQQVEDEGLLGLVLSFGGAYVFRFIRGSTKTLSNHAFGVAIDLNMKENGLGKRPALLGEAGTLRRVAPIFERWGFFWGGYYRNRKDGMHFECVKRFGSAEIDEMLAALSTADHIRGLVVVP